MNHIRSALAAGLLVFGGAVVASAQQATGATPAPRHQAHAQQAGRQRGPGSPFLKGITLTSAEKANIKNVHAKYAQQLKALRGPNATAEQRAQAKQLMLSERNELRGALSAENQAKFDANVARFQARAAKRGR